MAFYLVLSLAATAGLFFLAGADFVGAMQLMIYVGGTLVLLIFGVMLTAQERVRLDEDQPRRNVDRRRIVGACAAGRAGVGGGQRAGVAAASIGRRREAMPLEPTAAPLGMGLLGARRRSRSSAPDRSGYLLVV